jgi:ankyrin repeat protein
MKQYSNFLTSALFMFFISSIHGMTNNNFLKEKFLMQQPLTSDEKKELALYAFKTEKWPILNDVLNSNFDVNVLDRNGQTLLHHIIASKVYEIKQLIITLNVQNNIEEISYTDNVDDHRPYQNKLLTFVNLLLKKGARVNVQDYYGDTPLHIAHRSNNMEVVELLLGAGADETQINYNNHTPLQLLFMHNKESMIIHHDGDILEQSLLTPNLRLAASSINT